MKVKLKIQYTIKGKFEDEFAVCYYVICISYVCVYVLDPSSRGLEGK